jgi:hypothetical protein
MASNSTSRVKPEPELMLHMPRKIVLAACGVLVQVLCRQ